MDDAVAIARWQFGVTTVYHFLFVPITMALSMLVAIMQHKWLRSGDEKWLKLSKFYGKLFLINFVAGVVTGIVQEFQFGMNWSEYSRFVGDIFGAPLAFEALLAFFLESTFIGIWIFGRGRVNDKVHLASIYLASIGSIISAVFILAANSWMQNPVGAVYRNGRAEMADFGAVMTNPVFLAQLPHTLAAAFMVAGALVAGTAGWHMWRAARLEKGMQVGKQKGDGTADEVEQDQAAIAGSVREKGSWRSAMKMGAWTLLIASLAVVISGDILGKTIVQTQPMKMAAAEAIWKTEAPASFSVVKVGTGDPDGGAFSLDVPKVLSFLAHGDFETRVQGITDLEQQYKDKGFLRDDGTQLELQRAYADELAKYNLDSVHPNVTVIYWTFRLMIGIGMLGALAALIMLIATRKDRETPTGRWWVVMCQILPFLPLIACSFGWIFTEMGRQPWIVAGVLPTSAAVSPGVSAASVLFSLIAFTLVYAIIAVIVLFLFIKYIKLGLPDVSDVPEYSDDDDSPVSFAY